ncbi:unnamed protein product [Closterium sp. Naga37s-1]|nr:unnamed protein product [Closterium sp. Naga37s-1]
MDRPYQGGSAAASCVEEGGRKGETLDDAAAEELAAKLRLKFRTGETRNLAWREQQLRNLVRMAEEHEEDIMTALKTDLGRGRMEALIEVWHWVWGVDTERVRGCGWDAHVVRMTEEHEDDIMTAPWGAAAWRRLSSGVPMASRGRTTKG